MQVLPGPLDNQPLAQRSNSISTVDDFDEQNDWSGVPPLVDLAPTRPRRPLERVPELVELFADGWEVLEESHLWSFLPCVWPMDLCGWVADIQQRTGMRYDAPDFVETPYIWSEDDHIQEQAEVDATLIDHFQLRPLPPDRLWLLHMPPGATTTVTDFYPAMMDETERRVGPYTNPDLLSTVRTEIKSWPSGTS